MQDIAAIFNTFHFLDLSSPLYGIAVIVIGIAVAIIPVLSLKRLDGFFEKMELKIKTPSLMKKLFHAFSTIVLIGFSGLCIVIWSGGVSLFQYLYENYDSIIAKGEVNLITFNSFKSKLTPEQIVKLNSAILLTYEGDDKAERLKAYQNADKTQLFWKLNEVKSFLSNKSENFIVLENLTKTKQD